MIRGIPGSLSQKNRPGIFFHSSPFAGKIRVESLHKRPESALEKFLKKRITAPGVLCTCAFRPHRFRHPSIGISSQNGDENTFGKRGSGGPPRMLPPPFRERGGNPHNYQSPDPTKLRFFPETKKNKAGPHYEPPINSPSCASSPPRGTGRIMIGRSR
jgi:hypothetical protein